MLETGAVWWNARSRLPPPSPQSSNSSERSRYQVDGLRTRERTRSMARGEKVTGPSPGGAPRHFCEQEPAASIPHASISTGMPPKDETQSTATMAPKRGGMSATSGVGGEAP